jgi:uncharacterized protein with ParB-like and HNH nuclease domain
MKASETNFQSLIEGTKQYIVPLFQRPYSWDKKQWQDLLLDLNDLYENESTNTHFIGSIVTMPTLLKPENNVASYLLIDGQQRLTTIFILLILLRDIAKENGEILADKIQNTLLTNQYVNGLEHFKLLPTQQDRDAFLGLIENKEVAQKNSSIIDCYHFFKKGIRDLESEKLNQVIANRLSVVSIVLERDDNPYIVFESLNAKGRSLTQADLIRNYFFMKIDLSQQDAIYNKYWLPMQESLGENLTEFMRHYLASDGVIVKTNEVYLVLKNKVDRHKDALAELNRIKQFADFYAKIVNPEMENNTIVKQNLLRIKRLDFTVVYPFLLNCYFDFDSGKLSANDFVDVLKILENFLIRRLVCNIPTHGLNKILPLLYHNALNQVSSFTEGLKICLQSQNYPKDGEFRKNLIESASYSGDKQVKTRLILETLENSFNHKEKPSFENVSIEHIMPQTITNEWELELGEAWQQDHDLYLNTLGNLTLTAYNSELSNKSFSNKKERFKKSNFSLNAYFDTVEKWDKIAIEQRADFLAEKVLGIWAYFGSANQTVISNNSVKGTKPKTLIIQNDKYAVKTWKDVYVTVLNWVVDYEPDIFSSLSQDYPSLINQKLFNSIRSTQLKNGYYADTHLSAESIYRFCGQVMQRVGLSSDDWKVETE